MLVPWFCSKIASMTPRRAVRWSPNGLALMRWYQIVVRVFIASKIHIDSQQVLKNMVHSVRLKLYYTHKQLLSSANEPPSSMPSLSPEPTTPQPSYSLPILLPDPTETQPCCSLPILPSNPTKTQPSCSLPILPPDPTEAQPCCSMPILPSNPTENQPSYSLPILPSNPTKTQPSCSLPSPNPDEAATQPSCLSLGLPSDPIAIQGLLEQLFSPNLLRLWRTGADHLCFSYKEDVDLDVSYIYNHTSGIFPTCVYMF